MVFLESKIPPPAQTICSQGVIVELYYQHFCQQWTVSAFQSDIYFPSRINDSPITSGCGAQTFGPTDWMSAMGLVFRPDPSWGQNIGLSSIYLDQALSAQIGPHAILAWLCESGWAPCCFGLALCLHWALHCLSSALHAKNLCHATPALHAWFSMQGHAIQPARLVTGLEIWQHGSGN